MKLRHWSHGIGLLALSSLPFFAPAQPPPDDELARGAFLKTRDRAPRPSPTKSPKPPPRSPDKPSPGPPDGSQTPIEPLGPIGLGYTFFKHLADGRVVRVEPNHVFRTGDEVRLVVEPNIDGYLYVFVTEITKDGEGAPVLLFPNPRLNRGENRIMAHVPYEVPSSFEPDPDNRWFVFKDPPSTNRLWLIVSRRPLSDAIPSGQKLLALCQSQSSPTGCQWEPESSYWKKVVADAGAERRTSVKQGPVQVLSVVERDAATRGIGLKPKDPQPWTVEVSATPTADSFVVKADLIQQ